MNKPSCPFCTKTLDVQTYDDAPRRLYMDCWCKSCGAHVMIEKPKRVSSIADGREWHDYSQGLRP